jgi:hypothetical protein
MINVSRIGKISKVVCKPSLELSVKHVIQVGKYVGKKNDSGITQNIRLDSIYVYDYTDKKINEKLTGIVYSSTDDHILLTNDTKSVDKDIEKLTQSNAYSLIYPKHFYQTLKTLDKVMKWLTDSEYENLFTVDQNGKTVGVSNNKIFLTVQMMYNKFLLFAPKVVYDKDENSHQGIMIKSETGILGSLTGEEFSLFYIALKELMNNFYGLSLQLFTACMTYLEKSGGKNGS